MLYVDGAKRVKFVGASIAFVYVFFALGRVVSFVVVNVLAVNTVQGQLARYMHSRCSVRVVTGQAM